MKAVSKRVRFTSSLIAAIVLAFAVTRCERSDVKPAPTTAPATQPAPTTTQAAQPPKPPNYFDVLRASYPRVAATQPLDWPLELADAGHFLLKQPVSLDWRGDLWITASNAAPIEQVFKTAADEQTHVLREHVVFAHWTVDKKGKWHPHLIVKTGDKYEWLDEAGRKPIGSGKNYRWDLAQVSGDDRLVVPTDRGISIFDVASEPIEYYQQLARPTPDPPSSGLGTPDLPLFVFDPGGIIAWILWGPSRPGSDGAWRFADKKWTHLNEKSGWPQKVVHLVPLLDGSVLQLSMGDDGKLALSMTALGQTSVDEAQIRELVKQMSDPDPQKRQEAYNELTRYGNASWPVLEKLKDDQPLEARVRIEQLLENKTQPTLGGKNLVDGKARLVGRFGDGGVLLYAEAGASIPREDQAPMIVAPAWISIRPGRSMELLDEVLTQDLDPDQHRVFAWGDEWIVGDKTRGPRQLRGNHMQPMLKDSEIAFAHFVGRDRGGRWLFRKEPLGDETLILDVTVPDPTPRLPIWLLDIKKGKVGWEKNNWPVIKRPGAWFLNEYGWQGLDEKTNPIITELPGRLDEARAESGAASTTSPATTRAVTTTQATTQAATTQPLGPPILVDSKGRKYYDGRKTLTVIEPSGRQIVWPLPDTAVGTGEVYLIQAKDGALFLFNAPGRLLKIQPTPEQGQPYRVDATFTHRIPNVDHFTRVWLDPANRIIMAYDTRLAILFPEGRIPPALQRLIPAIELEDQAP